VPQSLIDPFGHHIRLAAIEHARSLSVAERVDPGTGERRSTADTPTRPVESRSTANELLTPEKFDPEQSGYSGDRTQDTDGSEEPGAGRRLPGVPGDEPDGDVEGGEYDDDAHAGDCLDRTRDGRADSPL
jgi:hypothetical protein